MSDTECDRIPVKVRKICMENNCMKITWEPHEGAIAYEVPGKLDQIVFALVPKGSTDDNR